MKLPFARLFAALISAGLVGAADLKPTEAATHQNETATVVGIVTQASERKGHIFLNFEHPYPRHTFTAFIPQKSVAAAGGVPFLTSLQGKTVAVTGRIVEYNGKPEIIVTAREQIAVR